MAEPDTEEDSQVVVGIGEALFDCFPDRNVLGGAPVNVVVHVLQLLAPTGGCGVVVSRIGEDELGRNLTSELRSRGIVSDSIQIDSRVPTGTVRIQVSELGEPSYEIIENVAWDAIEFSESLRQLAIRCNAVCFGTLAQRSQPSRSTIQRFLSCATNAVRLFDVNLRQNYFDGQILRDSLNAATVVKLNWDELSQIENLFGENFGAGGSADDILEKLAELFDLECIALTRGSEGSVIYTKGKRIETESISIVRSPGADNVGAGDAYSAGLIYGLLKHWEPARIAELANHMGAYVASHPGATPGLPEDIIRFAKDGSSNP